VPLETDLLLDRRRLKRRLVFWRLVGLAALALAAWLGVPAGQLASVFPNITKFSSPTLTFMG